MADVRCPMCGKSNPADAEVCQFCQARIKPLGASQPPQPPKPEEPGDWLGSLREGGELGEGEAQAEGPGEADWQAGEVSPESDEDLLPDWLARQDAGSEEETAGPAEPAQFLPDWLRRDGEEPGGEGALPAGEERLAGGESAAPYSGVAAWLASLDAETPGSADQPGASRAELPDWLAGLGDEEAPAEAEAAPAAAPAEALPDWLTSLGAEEETPVPAETEAAPAEALPDWLTSLGAEEETPASAEAEAAPAAVPAAALPDWLAELGEETPAEEQPAPAETELTAADLPAWLRDAEEAPAPAAVGEAPDWLASLRDQDFETEEASPVSEEPAKAEIPDWLAELRDEEAEPQPPAAAEPKAAAPAEAPAEWPAQAAQPVEQPGAETMVPFALDGEFDTELEALETGEVPDWLTEVSSEDVEIGRAGEEAAEAEGLAQAELPEWLAAMRPVSSVAAPEAQVEEELAPVDSGPLMGLRGVLMPELEATRTGKPEAFSMRANITEGQQRHITLLEKLMTSEEAVQPVEKPAGISSQRILRWVIAAALIVVVYWVIRSGSQAANLPAPGPEVQAVSQLINGVGTQSPVLVAFDYDPALSGEMEAAAAAVMDHLMLRGAYLTVVSTTPSGPVLAERFLHTVQRQHNYVHGEQYINLGYIPGGATGLATFANLPLRSALPYTFSGYTAWEPRPKPLLAVESLENYRLALVITDNAETARAWIEQLGPSLGNAPLVMVVSAQAEPLVRPYYEASPRQIDGLVAGLAGGGAYGLLIGRAGPTRVYWDAFGAGLMVVEALILIGAVYNLLSASLKRGPQETKGETADESA
jgi:hypothetical protein